MRDEDMRAFVDGAQPFHAAAAGWTEASMYKPKNIDWLWKNRLLAGRINLIAGMGDVGKDVLCCDIAATFSTGRNWYDGSPCVRGRVGYVSAEDEPEDTLVPRLLASGADISQVRIWSMDRPPSPADLDGLGLLIVSPLIEILADGKDADTDRGARASIKPWQAKAKEIGCTVCASSFARRLVSAGLVIVGSHELVDRGAIVGVHLPDQRRPLRRRQPAQNEFAVRVKEGPPAVDEELVRDHSRCSYMDENTRLFTIRLATSVV